MDAIEARNIANAKKLEFHNRLLDEIRREAEKPAFHMRITSSNSKEFNITSSNINDVIFFLREKDFVCNNESYYEDGCLTYVIDLEIRWD